MSNFPIIEPPVHGHWKLIPTPGHERFAFDLVAIDPLSHRLFTKPGWQHWIGKMTVQDSYSWIKPVIAPVSGDVVAASDGWPDRYQLHLIRDLARTLLSRPKLTPEDIRPFAGNYIILESHGFFVVLAHFKQGSLQVSVGDRVTSGQTLGAVGNSGFSIQPHLHFQLMDQINNLTSAKAVPFKLSCYQRWDGRSFQPVDKEALNKGDIVLF